MTPGAISAPDISPPPPGSAPPRISCGLSTICTKTASPCCWTGCLPTSARTPRAFMNSTAPAAMSTATPTSGSMPAGAPGSLTTAVPKSKASCSPPPGSGWKSIISTACGSTRLPPCCIWTTAARAAPGRPTSTAGTRIWRPLNSCGNSMPWPFLFPPAC